MYSFAHTVPVNPPGASPILSWDELWRGLVRKAEDPVGFVNGMESSTVLERSEDGLVREAVYRDTRIRERVSFQEPDSVRFEQIDTEAPGAVTNEIADGKDGLELTFTFTLRFRGVAEGSEEERRRGTEVQPMLTGAVGHTVEAVRALAELGKL